MNDNVNGSTARPAGDNSGDRHFEQGGGRRNNRSRNNHRRHDRPADAGETQSSTQNQQRSPNNPSQGNTPNNPTQGSVSNNRPGNSPRQDFHNNPKKNNNRPSRPQPYQNNKPSDKSEQPTDRSVTVNRNEHPSGNVQNKPQNQNQNTNVARSERPKESRNWGRNIRSEETYEDIRRDNERVEKEIWLEIAGIHTCKLD